MVAEIARAPGATILAANPTPSNDPGPPFGATLAKRPEAKWCGECGAEWTLTNDGQIFITCGHNHAERVDDPRKAKNLKPPAGLQARTEHEVAKRNAEDEKTIGDGIAEKMREKGAYREGASSKQGPIVMVDSARPDRVTVGFGEARFPVPGDQYNHFKTAMISVSTDVAPGENRVDVAERILADVERIAEMAYERELAWYTDRLGRGR
jgi:hypothetical protein